VGPALRLLLPTARLWWRIRKPLTLGVRAVVLDPAEQIALVRHTYADPWYLPGGGVKRWESYADAVRRELAEEAGLTEARIERILGAYHNTSESKDDHIVAFVLRVEATSLQPTDALEIAEARWFPLDGLPDNASPATLRRIAEYRAGAVGTGDW
jgi:ADP-ribose pyrophosphatase YjhB (NUDIX family)